MAIDIKKKGGHKPKGDFKSKNNDQALVPVEYRNKNKSKNALKKKPDVGAHLNALPTTFKFAAETLKKMSERGGSVGSIVVNTYKSYNYKLIYALVMNTVKNIKIIKKIIHETKLAKKAITNDPFMLEILVGDLLYGRGLKSVEQNQTASGLIKLKDSIIKQQEALKDTYSKGNDQVDAKYIRVNHLKSTMPYVLGQLKTAGLKQVEYSKDKIKFKKFINKFKSMEENEFMLDFHFPDDLIILKKTDNLKRTELVKKGKAMIQDKASFMAVEALDVKPSQKVIDACCAPGCKTSIIAVKMKNKGKIFAFDMDKRRLLSAKHLLKVQGVTCADAQVQDFSKVKLQRLMKQNSNEKFEAILIDPSCSGSGIKSRVDYKASQMEEGRLKKLQAFQVALLKHALKADVSNTIVYCTCSQSVEENEQVVEMALNESGVKNLWDVVEALPYWPHRGEANYEFGSKCLRSDENNLTNGFFIAKLKRNNNKSSSTKAEEDTSSRTDNVKAGGEAVEMEEDVIEQSQDDEEDVDDEDVDDEDVDDEDLDDEDLDDEDLDDEDLDDEDLDDEDLDDEDLDDEDLDDEDLDDEESLSEKSD